MPNLSQSRALDRTLFVLAALVVIVAGLRYAQSVIVPFLLSVFIAVAAAPLLNRLQRLHLPRWLALLTVIATVIAVVFGLSVLIGRSVNEFTQDLPRYQTRLQDEFAGLLQWLHGLGLELPDEGLRSALDPGAAMRFASQLLTGLQSMLTNAFLILVTVSFILLESWSMPDKLRAAFPSTQGSLDTLELVVDKIRHYLGLKTVISLATGVLIAVWLALIGVEYPMLWGLIAFLFNYVPTIGSIIAGVPAVLLAFVQGGLPLALLTAGGYVAVNVGMGNVIEPRVMGRGLGLSALVVFLSLVVWGWVLGPVGMLLSVPLTMVVKVTLDTDESTRWLGILLGPPVSTDPEEAAATDNGTSG